MHDIPNPNLMNFLEKEYKSFYKNPQIEIPGPQHVETNKVCMHIRITLVNCQKCVIVCHVSKYLYSFFPKT